MDQVSPAGVPPEALEKARPVIAALREQLAVLFAAIPPGHNIATRFEAGEEQ